MLLLYSSNQVEVYRCISSLVSVPGGAQCPQGVLRSLLGWKLMGTSLLRNWMCLINPLQTSVEVHCQSQLVRKMLLSHVLTTPGWSSCRVVTLCDEFNAERKGQSCHQSREKQRGPSSCSTLPSWPQQVNLSLFPLHVLCKDSLKAPWAPSFSQVHLPIPFGLLQVAAKAPYLGPGALHALAQEAELPGWVSCAGQRPQHPWVWIRSCFPVGSREFSAHTTFILHTIKKHTKKLYQKKKERKEKKVHQELTSDA